MIEGYLPETAYLATFIRELAPAWLDRVALSQGLAPPRSDPGQPFRYCELGCGLGVTTNILAATCPNGTFLGIDALPNHIEAAASLAREGGIGNAAFRALRFEDALDDPHEPFDYIVAHGVYSWVDRANREYLLDFVERHLKPGGLFYLSYNALPGWNHWVPVQKLLLEAAAQVGGDPEARFEQAAALIRAMSEADARYLKGNPALEDFKERTRLFPAGYLVHEYMIPAWEPCHGSDIVAALARRGLEFVGSAMQTEQREEFLLRGSQRELLAAEPDPGLRELMKDMFLNTGFRKDLYARSAAVLDGREVFLGRANQHYARNPAVDVQELQLATPAGTLRFDNLAARELLRWLEDSPTTCAAAATRSPEATLADFVNTADALWAADVIRPVDPQIPGCSLQGINHALQRMAEAKEMPGLMAVPHGTALPVKA